MHIVELYSQYIVIFKLIHQYTADFVVKAPIGIGIFVIALLLVTLISMGTLWWQIRKAANLYELPPEDVASFSECPYTLFSSDLLDTFYPHKLNQ